MRYTSSDTEVSFFADGYALSNSVFYNATIIANNSVGLSEPFIYTLFVPGKFIVCEIATSSHNAHCRVLLLVHMCRSAKHHNGSYLS